MPRLYIDEHVGITNRLEELPLAFAISRAYGHEIILDWHELDALDIEGTRPGKVRILARIGALRVRRCDREQFDRLAGRKIILRGAKGPDEILDPIYLESARRVHIRPGLAESIREMFNRAAGRPVVGVHIRYGDYTLADESRYETEGVEWPAVPAWWYEKTMAAITERRPDVCFFLSATGDPALYAGLHERFDVMTLDIPSPYTYKGEDHTSSVHPVADLFALACCPLILATPFSGFSHWAANALGEASTCLVPLPGATPDRPLIGRVDLYGRRMPRWRTNSRHGGDTVTGEGLLDEADLTRPAATGWL